MIKFIELTSATNLPMAINIDEIQGITEDGLYTSIFLKGDKECYKTKETVSQVLAKIRLNQ